MNRMVQNTLLHIECLKLLREWTGVEIEIMETLAAIVSHEFDLRAMVRMDAAPQSDLDDLYGRIDVLFEQVKPDNSKEAFLESLRHWQAELDL